MPPETTPINNETLTALSNAMGRAPSSSWIQRLYNACAFCLTTGGTGIFASHAGCVVTPIVTALSPWAGWVMTQSPISTTTMAAIGIAADAALIGLWHWGKKHEFSPKTQRIVAGFAATALSLTAVSASAAAISAADYQPFITALVGTGITATVLAGWYALRGRHVSHAIRRLTVGTAAASLALSTGIRTPHMYDMWETYHRLVASNPNGRAGVIKDAQALRMSLDAWVEGNCTRRSDLSDWQKIKKSFGL